MPWNNAYLGSLHGRCEEFLEKINDNQLSIWLTDKENNPAFYAKLYMKLKLNVK